MTSAAAGFIYVQLFASSIKCASAHVNVPGSCDRINRLGRIYENMHVQSCGGISCLRLTNIISRGNGMF